MTEPTSTEPTPTFGRAMLEHWALDPAGSYLNHGTVGVVPRCVLEEAESIRREIESHPSRFMLREIVPLIESAQGEGRLREAAAKVAEFVGARSSDLAFIDNATSGTNAVLRSFPIPTGKSLLIMETTYGGVKQAARYAARQAGTELRVARLPLPVPDEQAVLDVFDEAMTPDVALAIVDHIVSETGIVLPIAEIAEMCHSRGIRILIDGAHAPAQLDLDLPSYGVDWYVGNLHKWAHAPRSTGILWASEEAQQGLHPAVVSWRLDEGMTREFDWMGTKDPSPWLAAPAGLRLLHEWGLERVRQWNHDTLWNGIEHLQTELGGRTSGPRSMTSSMVALELPQGLGTQNDDAFRLRDGLLFEEGIEVQVQAWDGRLWLRASAQVYNDQSDFDRLTESLKRRLDGSTSEPR